MKQRPFSRYTQEEIDRMSDDEFFALMEEHNAWVRKHYAQLKESNKPRPKFNTIEELEAYYNCRPLEEVGKDAYKMFGI